MKAQKGEKVLAVLLTLALWQLLAMAIDQSLLIASPVQVLARLFSIWKEPAFFASVWFSFGRIVCGFLLALVMGCGLAVLSGKSHKLEVLLWPLFTAIKTVPVASFIVISLIWFSSDHLSTFISFLMVLPIIYTNVLTGIHSIDPKLGQMADVFRVPWKRRFTYIWLPQIKPYLLSSCSLALGISWKSGIAAEVIGIPRGSIGEMLYMAKAYFNTVDLFAWTVVIVLLSVGFEKLFLALLNSGYRRLEQR